MNRPRGSLAVVALPAAVAAATTWIALLSWRGFTVEYGGFLGPLLLLAIVVAGTGTLARWWRTPGPVVVLVQVIAAGLVASTMLSGSPLPVGAAWPRLMAAFTEAVDTANRFAPPVPPGAPAVDPLLIAGGLGCLLLVDVLACTLRRVPLAGLPLLTIFSVPVSMLGTGMSPWIFTLTAAGFLTMMFLHESEQVFQWGRAFDSDPGAADRDTLSVHTGTMRTSAGAIGGVATALALFLPLLIPAWGFQVFDFGRGPGGDGDIKIENPMADLRRDLIRGEDVELLQVTTDDPDPSYLRIAVLNRFNGSEWSSGDRDVPADNAARGEMPALVGVDETVAREEFDYGIVATSEFQSTWLPTQPQISRIEAPGDWRYDADTMDFLSSDDELDAAELAWDFRAIRLDLDADAIARSASTGTLVGDEFTDLPEGISSMVGDLAEEVTAKSVTRFEKAVALQNWFRRGGGFTYDTSVNPGNGSDDLVRFLEDSEDGRTGYCEQFAAAMAVMARELGIPARVAIGFLTPQQTGSDTWSYSAHDLHAWPELFFAGAGWVRFEPTPPGRASGVPSYTTDTVTPIDPDNPSGGAGQTAPPVRDSATALPRDPSVGETDESAGASSGFPWLRLVGGLALALAVLALALTPRSLRSRRREVRLSGGPEEVWLELRDTALDLGLVWPQDRSPRQTRDVLVGYFGAPVDEFTPELPRRGPEVNPDAVLAVDRIVHALERGRYARADGGPAGTWRAETQTCEAAMTGGATRRARRVATWWPRSLFVRARPASPVAGEEVEQPTYGRVVDHVG